MGLWKYCRFPMEPIAVPIQRWEIVEMAAKRRGLGARDLDVLLGVPEAETSYSEGELRQLGVTRIQPGKYQPRRAMDEDRLQELAASIKSQGVIQPIVVRPIGAQRYEIIAGERRWRAAQLAGLTEIPAVIREVADEAAVAMALIENIQREDLNPLEEARALHRLIEEFGLTHQAAATAVGRSRVAVSNLLRLMELTDEVKALLEQRSIEMGHARALLGLSVRRQQIEVALLVAKKGLSVRDTEALVRRLLNPAARKSGEEDPVDPDIRRLEHDLADKLGAKVAFQHHATGKGRLV